MRKPRRGTLCLCIPIFSVASGGKNLKKERLLYVSKNNLHGVKPLSLRLKTVIILRRIYRRRVQEKIFSHVNSRAVSFRVNAFFSLPSRESGRKSGEKRSRLFNSCAAIRGSEFFSRKGARAVGPFLSLTLPFPEQKE